MPYKDEDEYIDLSISQNKVIEEKNPDDEIIEAFNEEADDIGEE